MNTIPTTFNIPDTSYTVIGGKKKNKKISTPSEISFLVLIRGERFYIDDFLVSLERLGIFDVLIADTESFPYDIEALAAKHPRCRFLIFQKPVSIGKMINTGIEESHGNYIFVLWNDIRIPASLVLKRLLPKVKEHSVLCLVPLLQNRKYETLPTIKVPAFFRKTLKMVSLSPSAGGMATLFPSDYLGIYRKELFVLTGGYDVTIQNPYWQKMDFGFRSYMWDEKILCETGFRLLYTGDVPAEDTTPDEYYKYFFLKNLCIRFQGDSGILPFSRFPSYLIKSGDNFFESLRDFKTVKKWVNTNTYRFKQDARSVTELWELPEM